jgi:hypothetical protein
MASTSHHSQQIGELVVVGVIVRVASNITRWTGWHGGKPLRRVTRCRTVGSGHPGAAGQPETPCKATRPSRIPSLIWSDTAGPPTAAVGPPPQLQLRTPNALGSALTGMATPTAAPNATAALNKIFVTTRRRAVGRGAYCAFSAPLPPNGYQSQRTGFGRAMESAVCVMLSSLPSGGGRVAHASATPRYLLPATVGQLRQLPRSIGA